MVGLVLGLGMKYFIVTDSLTHAECVNILTSFPSAAHIPVKSTYNYKYIFMPLFPQPSSYRVQTTRYDNCVVL